MIRNQSATSSRGGRRGSRLVALFVMCMSLMVPMSCSAGTGGTGSASNAPAGTSTGTTGTGGGNNGGGNNGGGAGNTGSGKWLTYEPCCSWNTTWSFNRYNTNGLGITDDFVQLRLAIQKYPSLTEYEPQLAEKWEQGNGTLTVHLRKDAKWEDGKPVTATDVVNTAYLNATRGDGFWNTITNAKAQDDQTVVFTQAKDVPDALVLDGVLQMIIMPSQTYGSLVTDDLKKNVDTWAVANAKDPEAAANTAEFKAMGTTFQKLAALKVDKVIGDGPFKLDSINTQQAKLPKSTTFWGADKIKMAGINYLNGSNQAIYATMFNNVDMTNVYMSPPLVKRWTGTPNAKLATPLAFGFVMGFNNSVAPLNDVKVRQALAYVIDRQAMSDAAYGSGKGAGGAAKDVITGISPTLEKLYLTEDQIKQLNPYKHDTAKATELLKQAGMTQKGGKWYMKDGQQFKMTLTVNADTSDIVLSYRSAAASLQSFGIDTQVNATSGAQQDANQHNGNFQAGMYFIGGNNPLGMYNNMMGPGNNFSTSGNYAGKKGIGFGPKMDVPGLGNVNISTTLNQQANTADPNGKMKDYVWSWAQLVNQQVPYIWYATKVYQFSYSEKNFTNWPPQDANGTSPLWDMIGNSMGQGMSIAIQQGYIVPKG